jgi:hypothetical protein
VARFEALKKTETPSDAILDAHAEFCAAAGACETHAELDAFLGAKTDTHTIAVPKYVLEAVVASSDYQLHAAVAARGAGLMEQLREGLQAKAPVGGASASGSASASASGLVAPSFKFGELDVQLSPAEKQSVLTWYRERSQPPATSTGSVTARTCVVCLEPRRPQDCEAMCAQGGKSHFACKACLDRVTPVELPKPGDEISLMPYRCFVCREFRPQLPPHIRQIAAAAAQGLSHKVCVHPGCGRIFGYHPQCGAGGGGGGAAGEGDCGEHSRELLKTFACPRCHIKLQHAGGCRLIRCCPQGYHGCGMDRGEACAHRVCSCDGACAHDQGCGHTFVIGDEQAEEEEEEASEDEQGYGTDY